MAFQPEEAARQDLMNDDVVSEILLRLPSAAVLRSRAVCRAWRRIASSAAFAAAHARRRPLELIFQRHGPSGALESIPAAALDEPQRRCLDVEYPEESSWRGYNLIASCDGLLLFQRGRGGGTYYVCNPVTRQWTTVLPRPAGTFTLPCGFYVHGPTREHRLLCLTSDHQGSHYVYSLEAAQARRLGQALPVMRLWADQPICSLNHRGKLHWLRHPRVIFSTENLIMAAGDDDDKYKILAFDTVSETFRRISRPPLRRRDGVAEFFLLEMDGMLAMADFLDGSMHLSVLEDYNDDKSWTRRLQVYLPAPLRHACWAVNADVEAAAGQDVILLGDSRTCWVGLYHVKQKRVLKKILLADNERRGIAPPTLVHALLFRDSLERHNFFHLHHSPQ